MLISALYFLLTSSANFRATQEPTRTIGSQRHEMFLKKATKKKPQCSDGKDNDHDGKIDYPRDKGCTSRNDNSEKNTKRPSAIKVGIGSSLHGKRIFPADNAWNKDISNAPVDPRSAVLINSIGASTSLHPDWGTSWEGRPIGFPYLVVNQKQPKSTIDFDYASESDRGPYPIPLNAPIEGGNDSSGDRHVFVIDKDNWKLYELFDAHPGSNTWHAGSGAIFNLKSNALRPAGWTSADAAGLPIFPGLVRYDEVFEQKEITHALRFTASNTRHGYVSPARHSASSQTDPSLPPMGMRVRLKANFDVSPFPGSVQVVLRALKKYGMFLADNGSPWFISGVHDARWNDDQLSKINQVHGSDFEVIAMGDVVTN